MTPKAPPDTLVSEYCQLKCYAVTTEDHELCRADRYEVEP